LVPSTVLRIAHLGPHVGHGAPVASRGQVFHLASAPSRGGA
jgi:hypothetical protein